MPFMPYSIVEGCEAIVVWHVQQATAMTRNKQGRRSKHSLQADTREHWHTLVPIHADHSKQKCEVIPKDCDYEADESGLTNIDQLFQKHCMCMYLHVIAISFQTDIKQAQHTYLGGACTLGGAGWSLQCCMRRRTTES